MPTPAPQTAQAFITRWGPSGAAERANAQMFLAELCDLIGVPRPDPATEDDAKNGYVFEKSVKLIDKEGAATTGRIDLYKRGCFVLETKQGVGAKAKDKAADGDQAKTKKGHGERGTRGYDLAMMAARAQAENYVRHLPGDNPPFLLVVDVGHSIEMYADFTRMGKVYQQFPSAKAFRITLAQLKDEDVRNRLRLVFTDPDALNPARISEKVTRDVAEHLAKLGASLEKSGHPAGPVGHFLTRCLFTLFAEDVGLIPKDSFAKIIESCQGDGKKFQSYAEFLWRDMDAGRYNAILGAQLLRFNGKFFHDSAALPLTAQQLHLLAEAARKDWGLVEPAIFGTLLERALDPRERHKLGAHYTPRSYVERLVIPTVIEPLQEDWNEAKTKAKDALEKAEAVEGISKKADQERTKHFKAARGAVIDFLKALAATRVLDPACGSGNFLYVAMEHMKRLEGEATDFLDSLGHAAGLDFTGVSVDPHQFLGLELNPKAAALAELVLWIGHLQWHLRQNEGAALRDPVLEDYGNIKTQDAVLAHDGKAWVKEADGRPKMRWDGHTMKTDPATGREVPDEAARIPVELFAKPEPAVWPEAEFVVGNPPFLGDKVMRQSLGDGYVDALRAAYPELGDSTDFVLYWWHKAAQLTREGKLRRFGLITTNSIRQTFNRRVLEMHMAPEDAEKAENPGNAGHQSRSKQEQPPSGTGVPRSRAQAKPLVLRLAVPDHPWVEASDGAAVRIAMTVGMTDARRKGRLQLVVKETAAEYGEMVVEVAEARGKIHPDLTMGANLTQVVELRANEGLSHEGFKPHGKGFIVTRDEAQKLGLGSIKGIEKHIRPYCNGKDLADRPRGVFGIDFFGMTAEEVRFEYPAAYQHLLTTVKPERDQNNRAVYRNNWWFFGEPRREMRPALEGLKRYIATIKTAKHRTFQFLDASVAADSKLIVFTLDSAFYLGVLSSRTHVLFSLSTGSWLGVGNDPTYVKSTCFESFPFPHPTKAQVSRIASLAEQIDALRKTQQAAHKTLTLTATYNCLEKLRSSEKITPKERETFEHGLVSTLLDLHRDLDRAVLEAYGWSDLAEGLAQSETHPDFEPARQDLLTRLAALNEARAKEEAKGKVAWLRPEYQAIKS